MKLCDTIGSTGMYRMRNAVHLEGLRCDGQAHGGCQAGCLLYWKEAWLRRVPSDGREPAGPPPEPAPQRLLATLAAATRKAGRDLRRRGAVLVPGDGIAPGGARARPFLGRQPVRAGRQVGQRQPARRRPRRRHRGVQRVPGPQPQVRAEATADPGRSTVALHRREAREDPGRQARPATRGTGRVRSKEEISARSTATTATADCRSTRRCCGTAGRGQGATAGRPDHRRAHRQAAAAAASLHRPRGRHLPRRLQPYCPRSNYPYWREIWLERVG